MEHIVDLCSEIPEVSEVKGYTRFFDALPQIEAGDIDVILMDIDMPDIKGLEAALMIREKNQDVVIIFLTGYSEYALEAFKIRANGYLLKPVSAEKIRNEIIYHTRDKNSEYGMDVKIQTFGNLEVFVNGEMVAFKRKKAKEILGILIDRQGSSVGRAEIAAVLWEDSNYDLSKQKILDVYIRSMRDTLKEYGIEGIIERKKGRMRMRPETVSCDFYDFLNGKNDAGRLYCGAYMNEYSWAELTAGRIDAMINSK